MPGVYKKKVCPECGVEHRKRGVYCGASCASKSRTHSEETIQKIIDGNMAYRATPEGIAEGRLNNRRVLAMRNNDPIPVSRDDFAVDIPDMIELPDGYDIADDW